MRQAMSRKSCVGSTMMNARLIIGPAVSRGEEDFDFWPGWFRRRLDSGTHGKVASRWWMKCSTAMLASQTVSKAILRGKRAACHSKVKPCHLDLDNVKPHESAGRCRSMPHSASGQLLGLPVRLAPVLRRRESDTCGRCGLLSSGTSPNLKGSRLIPPELQCFDDLWISLRAATSLASDQQSCAFQPSCVNRLLSKR